MRLRFIVLFLTIVLPIANVFGATFVVSSNQDIGGNNLQKGARLSFYEFQAEHGGYVVKFYVQVVIHLTSVSIVRIPGTQRRVIMPKTRINISIDQDLADFAKIFAMENRTYVAEMVTQYLFKGVEKYVPGKEFQFPDMLN